VHYWQSPFNMTGSSPSRPSTTPILDLDPAFSSNPDFIPTFSATENAIATSTTKRKRPTQQLSLFSKSASSTTKTTSNPAPPAHESDVTPTNLLQSVAKRKRTRLPSGPSRPVSTLAEPDIDCSSYSTGDFYKHLAQEQKEVGQHELTSPPKPLSRRQQTARRRQRESGKDRFPKLDATSAEKQGYRRNGMGIHRDNIVRELMGGGEVSWGELGLCVSGREDALDDESQGEEGEEEEEEFGMGLGGGMEGIQGKGMVNREDEKRQREVMDLGYDEGDEHEKENEHKGEGENENENEQDKMKGVEGVEGEEVTDRQALSDACRQH